MLLLLPCHNWSPERFPCRGTGDSRNKSLHLSCAVLISTYLPALAKLSAVRDLPIPAKASDRRPVGYGRLTAIQRPILNMTPLQSTPRTRPTPPPGYLLIAYPVTQVSRKPCVDPLRRQSLGLNYTFLASVGILQETETGAVMVFVLV